MNLYLVQLMVVFSVAVAGGVLFRFLKLPSLIGQVLAGFLIGLLGVINLHETAFLSMLGTIGVTLLLFLVGLEMNFKELAKVGRSTLWLFLIQTVGIGTVFVVFARVWFGFDWLPAVILSLAMTFSSTIVVVKMLSEGKDLGSLSGRVSLGVLILQDLLAILLMSILPSLGKSLDLPMMFLTVLKIFVLVFWVNFVGHYLMAMVEKYLIKSGDDLVLVSLVWLSLVVYLAVAWLELTPEIGGILAGISLSSSWGHFQIISKVKTLRDVFLTMFFVILGLEIGSSAVNWLDVSVLVAVIVLTKFVVTEVGGFLTKFSGKTTFSIGLNLTQISEFSLIVLTFGTTRGLWSGEHVNSVAMAGLMTMVLSTVMIRNSAMLYRGGVRYVSRWLRFNVGERTDEPQLRNHVVLLGGDRTGRSIINALMMNGDRVLVVDFNQEVVNRLKKNGVRAVFADASDPDVIDVAGIAEAKMVISTIKDSNDTKSLLAELKDRGIKVPIIVDAETAEQAEELYKWGASYVIFPHFVSGIHLGQMVRKFRKDPSMLREYRTKQSLVMKEVYGD